MPVDFRKVALLIKQYGIGLHQGQSVMITKVHLKKKHVEFQLGGGGYGTFADVMTNSMEHPTGGYYAGKSSREKDLEMQIKITSDPATKQNLKNELDDLRRERRRDNAWSASMNSQAQAANKQAEREKRAQSGSRFNIKYDEGFVPEEDKTPEGIMNVLAKFVEFPDAAGKPSGGSVDKPELSRPEKSSGEVTSLKKGLTIDQVESILGPAQTAEQTEQGGLQVMKRSYSHEGQRVSTSFVGGVLVDYSVSPE